VMSVSAVVRVRVLRRMGHLRRQLLRPYNRACRRAKPKR